MFVRVCDMYVCPCGFDFVLGCVYVCCVSECACVCEYFSVCMLACVCVRVSFSISNSYSSSGLGSTCRGHTMGIQWAYSGLAVAFVAI